VLFGFRVSSDPDPESSLTRKMCDFNAVVAA
jgi:hypothetical protein